MITTNMYRFTIYSTHAGCTPLSPNQSFRLSFLTVLRRKKKQIKVLFVCLLLFVACFQNIKRLLFTLMMPVGKLTIRTCCVIRTGLLTCLKPANKVISSSFFISLEEHGVLISRENEIWYWWKTKSDHDYTAIPYHRFRFIHSSRLI